jgi:serine/tyrosine/threonine adenylyltransferase
MPCPLNAGFRNQWNHRLRTLLLAAGFHQSPTSAGNFVGVTTLQVPHGSTSEEASRPLDRLPWDHRFTTLLPADTEQAPTKRRQVSGAAYSAAQPTPTTAPTTLCWSAEVAELLGLSAGVCETSDFAAVFSGNRVPDGAAPFAMVYGGHQFGNWAGQLGDGRAMALGEVVDRNGEHQMLQLKGAGPTPFSRTADGRAVLRSSIREFLCSEAMFHLGIPTTRALSLISTGDSVVRDMLYDGNPAPEPGAVVCRVAPSFTRFGNFQLPAARDDIALLRQLVTVTLATDFPFIAADATLTDEDKVVAFFAEVAQRNAKLVVDWMRVGFVHGVLNTDNLSIIGLTIDYGPYGWLESFDPNWTPNTTDAQHRRYRYGAQPHIVGWNLAQLASALVPLAGGEEIGAARLQKELDRFGEMYGELFGFMMAERFGWGPPRKADVELINEFFRVLSVTETDYLLFCRHLADIRLQGTEMLSNEALIAPLLDAYYQADDLRGDKLNEICTWIRKWAERVESNQRENNLPGDSYVTVIKALNPRFVLRNWIAQEVIDAADAGDPTKIGVVLEVLRRPYDDQPGNEHYALRRPEWARNRVGSSMLSCSS